MFSHSSRIYMLIMTTFHTNCSARSTTWPVHRDIQPWGWNSSSLWKMHKGKNEMIWHFFPPSVHDYLQRVLSHPSVRNRPYGRGQQHTKYIVFCEVFRVSSGCPVEPWPWWSASQLFKSWSVCASFSPILSVCLFQGFSMVVEAPTFPAFTK